MNGKPYQVNVMLFHYKFLLVLWFYTLWYAVKNTLGNGYTIEQLLMATLNLINGS